MIQTVLAFLKENVYTIIGVLVVVGLVFMFIKKQYDIFINAILLAEEKLNSGEGAKKLELAVEVIRGKMPILLKPFITKRVIVSIIEYLLNRGLAFMKSDKKVDIKGNDD